LAERPLCIRIITFLEEEHRHAEQGELTCAAAEVIDILLHAVAHVDERIDPPFLSLLPGMREHFPDLRIAALAAHGRHQPGQSIRIRNPFRGPALACTAEVDELYVEPTNL